jgi:hypothetical protein
MPLMNAVVNPAAEDPAEDAESSDIVDLRNAVIAPTKETQQLGNKNGNVILERKSEEKKLKLKIKKLKLKIKKIKTV